MDSESPPGASAVDPLIQRMRDSRKSPAILKLELARRRSTETEIPLLVLEGDDDKIIYSQWIGRLRPALKYGLFPCRGKGRVLELLDLIRRDATGLSRGVYFFVDRDFDDLRGRELGPDVYLTNSYSVENYIVSELVLDKILQIEFHCHACGETREKICKIFAEDYDNFLNNTKPINRALYVARKCGFAVDSITTTLSRIANVSVGKIGAGSSSAQEIIKSHGECSEEERVILEGQFDALDPAQRYRGKFALAFFKKWLRDLGENHRPGHGLFANIDSRSAFRVDELTLNSMASKSDMPSGLLEYIAGVEGPAIA